MVLPQALKMALWFAISPWVRVSCRYKQIPALGSPTAGSEYDFVDEWVLNGECYFYLLEDIYNSGISSFHGPVKATPRWIYGRGYGVQSYRGGIYRQAHPLVYIGLPKVNPHREKQGEGLINILQIGFASSRSVVPASIVIGFGKHFCLFLFSEFFSETYR